MIICGVCSGELIFNSEPCYCSELRRINLRNLQLAATEAAMYMRSYGHRDIAGMLENAIKESE